MSLKIYALYIIVAVAVLAGVLLYTKEDPPAVVSEDTIAALVACIIANKCQVARGQENIRWELVASVKIYEDQVKITYFFTDRDRLGVSFTFSEQRKVLVEDLDGDGVIDRVTQTTERPDGMAITYGREMPKRFLAAQRLYLGAMLIAEKKIIPPELLDAIRRDGMKSKGTVM